MQTARLMKTFCSSPSSPVMVRPVRLLHPGPERLQIRVRQGPCPGLVFRHALYERDRIGRHPLLGDGEVEHLREEGADLFGLAGRLRQHIAQNNANACLADRFDSFSADPIFQILAPNPTLACDGVRGLLAPLAAAVSTRLARGEIDHRKVGHYLDLLRAGRLPFSAPLCRRLHAGVDLSAELVRGDAGARQSERADPCLVGFAAAIGIEGAERDAALRGDFRARPSRAEKTRTDRPVVLTNAFISAPKWKIDCQRRRLTYLRRQG